MTERIIDTEQACHSQLCWRLKDSNNFFDRTHGSYRGRLAVDGSFRGIVDGFAACGWAVAPMDPDDAVTQWCGIGGIMSLLL